MVNLYLTFLIIHASTGAIALISGIIEVLLKKHGTFEKIFLISSFISIIGGIGMIPYIESGLNVQVAFGFLALLWFSFSLMLLRNILRNNKKESRKWFLRAFALVLFFTTVRIWRAIFVVLGVEYETAYGIAAWLGWTVNLLIVEYFIIER